MLESMIDYVEFRFIFILLSKKVKRALQNFSEPLIKERFFYLLRAWWRIVADPTAL